MRQIWPKYMQACLFEFATHSNQPALLLDKQCFEELPESALNNINDFKLFQNYKEFDVEIETHRALKHQFLTQLANKEINDTIRFLEGSDKKFIPALKEIQKKQVPRYISQEILNDTTSSDFNDEKVYNQIL